jgi:hypothetical protein
MGLLLAGLSTQPVLAEVEGPYILWWDLYIRGSDRYPGGTVNFTVTFVDTATATTSYEVSIDTVALTLPWETFVAPEPPIRLHPGEGFTTDFAIKIPEAQPQGNMTFILTVNWRYWDGSTWAAGNAIVGKFFMTIIPNPYALQKQVASLQSNMSSLTRTISSLNASLAASGQTINTLLGQVSSLTSVIAAQNQTINSQNTQISSQRDTITSLQTELNTTRTMMYVLIVTTVVFLATTAYFAMRKPRPPEAEKRT